MQSLEVISVNVWDIIISLCNLILLFLILKKFLYERVKKVISERQNAIDKQYDDALIAKNDAEEEKAKWQDRLSHADEEAAEIIRKSNEQAKLHGDRIISDAKDKAGMIINQAQSEAELELVKAKSEIKKEIVDVSVALTEKLLDREINENDHRNIINSFIDNLGKDDDANN